MSIRSVQPLGFPWRTQDPFLFCVYHRDLYPRGNDQLGPAASLQGRTLGQDFAPHPEGWRMYHGERVPGFPAHPHCGFETVTLVTEGRVDHSDSLGAAARFGSGDVQWMTAGRGVQHSEMFPLLQTQQDNPLELFQIWLNLPARAKQAPPHFSMFWNDQIPRLTFSDTLGKATRVKVVAGRLQEQQGPPPPPDSWAAEPAHDLAIWHIDMEAGAHWTLPAAAPGINRSLYFFAGDSVMVAGQTLTNASALELEAAQAAELIAGPSPVRLLLLQGRPIGEPVVQQGPFVGNTAADIQQAFREYQRTQFGGWPWPSYEPVHDRGRDRFARFPDGREEVPA